MLKFDPLSNENTRDFLKLNSFALIKSVETEIDPELNKNLEQIFESFWENVKKIIIFFKRKNIKKRPFLTKSLK